MQVSWWDDRKGAVVMEETYLREYRRESRDLATYLRGSGVREGGN